MASRLAACALALILAGCTAQPAGPHASPTRGGAPSVSASPSTVAPTTITIVGSGDVLLHPPLWAQAKSDARAEGRPGYDFEPILAGVKDVVSSADLAVCHLETPLAPPNGPFEGFPLFSVPPQVTNALADIGYDTCSTASNHTIDQGEAGVDRTIDTLDSAGIKHAGSYKSAHAHGTIDMLDVHGVKVAQLAYTFGFNGLQRPAGEQWLANQIDVPAILAEAKRARAAGAQIVLVSLHFGTEYVHAPNSQQLSVARQLLASPDVDLILGHHAHVVQPFEKIGDKWVVYGHGNEIAHHAEPVNDNREGVLSRFTFSQVSPGHWRVTKAEAIPVWMDLEPDRLVDIPHALADPATPSGERTTLRSALSRITESLFARGADKAGLMIAPS
jgi:capsule synthesis protein PGA_cap